MTMFYLPYLHLGAVVEKFSKPRFFKCFYSLWFAVEIIVRT